jgi:hypothetical protein
MGKPVYNLLKDQKLRQILRDDCVSAASHLRRALSSIYATPGVSACVGLVLHLHRLDVTCVAADNRKPHAVDSAARRIGVAVQLTVRRFEPNDKY